MTGEAATGSASDAAGIILERDVAVEMRDGVTLRCDIYRPADGKPVPALVQRQPYDKILAQAYVYDHPVVYARRGYAVVIQDSRGRYARYGIVIGPSGSTHRRGPWRATSSFSVASMSRVGVNMPSRICSSVNPSAKMWMSA